MKRFILMIAFVIIASTVASAQDDYAKRKAEGYMKEAEYYQDKADSYRNQAQYYHL